MSEYREPYSGSPVDPDPAVVAKLLEHLHRSQEAQDWERAEVYAVQLRDFRRGEIEAEDLEWPEIIPNPNPILDD